MGRAIYYCVQCSKRVSDSDIDAGKGFRIGERILCIACAPAGTKPTPSSKKIPAPAPRKNSGTSVALRSVTAPLAMPPPAPAETGGRRRLLILGGGIAAGVIVASVVLILVLRRDGAEPPPTVDQIPIVKTFEPPPGKPAEGAPLKPAEAKEAAARADLDKARAFAREKPDDLAGRQRAYTDVVWKWEGTEAAREAARDAAAAKAAILQKVDAWMAELNLQIKDLVDAKQYFAAERKVEELKKAHDFAEWRLAAEKRASELFALGKRAKEAEDAKKPEGLSTPATPSAPSEEAKGYEARWESAAARATSRDFAGAIAELEQAAPSLREAAVRQELDSDVALFRKIAAVRKDGMDYLTRRPRGAGLTVGTRDGKRISGIVLQIDPERAEIRSGKTTELVDWADVTAATFAELAQQKSFEPAVLAAMCLLEGEREAARGFEAELPARWGSYAAGAGAKLPKPEPAEKNARDLYAAAEKGFRSMDTFAAAVENYKTLRQDFATTALVKRYSERIFRRSDAGREYCFAPADFRTEGTIQTGKGGKLESTRDSDDRETLQNSAEVEFAALPGLTYRFWLQVGGCCEETLHFYLQATDLTETDPKTRKKIPCEPGSTFAVPVKHSIRNLKKTHDEHKVKGAKVHPKTASRWEWVEIVLPKYAGPGAKKLKFMTNQAGFSIGGACASSTRKAPPAEAEVKEMEKLRALEEPPMPVDPDLVAWWTFEEGSGDQIADQTGKNHVGKFVGAAQRTEGKIGGGLQVNGGDKSGVEVADAEDLRIAGNLTLSLWVKQTAESEDWVCLLGRGTSGARNYGIWLEPGTRKWMYQDYGEKGAINVFGTKLIDQGQWMHLSAVVEGSTVRTFTNGEPNDQGSRPGAPHTVPGPLGIGSALHHKSLKGVMDDVRVYRRALTADEIRGLYQLSR